MDTLQTICQAVKDALGLFSNLKLDSAELQCHIEQVACALSISAHPISNLSNEQVHLAVKGVQEALDRVHVALTELASKNQLVKIVMAGSLRESLKRDMSAVQHEVAILNAALQPCLSAVAARLMLTGLHAALYTVELKDLAEYERMTSALIAKLDQALRDRQAKLKSDSCGGHASQSITEQLRHIVDSIMGSDVAALLGDKQALQEQTQLLQENMQLQRSSKRDQEETLLAQLVAELSIDEEEAAAAAVAAAAAEAAAEAAADAADAAAVAAEDASIEAELMQGVICPISQELMTDPVIAASGHTYERAEITKWFKTHDTDPVTNMPLEHKALIPNFSLKGIISERRQKLEALWADRRQKLAALKAARATGVHPAAFARSQTATAAQLASSAADALAATPMLRAVSARAIPTPLGFFPSPDAVSGMVPTAGFMIPATSSMTPTAPRPLAPSAPMIPAPHAATAPAQYLHAAAGPSAQAPAGPSSPSSFLHPAAPAPSYPPPHALPAYPAVPVMTQAPLAIQPDVLIRLLKQSSSTPTVIDLHGATVQIPAGEHLIITRPSVTLCNGTIALAVDMQIKVSAKGVTLQDLCIQGKHFEFKKSGKLTAICRGVVDITGKEVVLQRCTVQLPDVKGGGIIACVRVSEGGTADIQSCTLAGCGESWPYGLFCLGKAVVSVTGTTVRACEHAFWAVQDGTQLKLNGNCIAVENHGHGYHVSNGGTIVAGDCKAVKCNVGFMAVDKGSKMVLQEACEARECKFSGYQATDGAMLKTGHGCLAMGNGDAGFLAHDGGFVVLGDANKAVGNSGDGFRCYKSHFTTGEACEAESNGRLDLPSGHMAAGFCVEGFWLMSRLKGYCDMAVGANSKAVGNAGHGFSAKAGAEMRAGADCHAEQNGKSGFHTATASAIVRDRSRV